MRQEKHDLVASLSDFQLTINSMTPGGEKDSVQTDFDTLILRLVRANACGPLRVGKEIPAAS